MVDAVLLRRSRIALTYRWRHGRWPSWAAPTLFTELVQRRKLLDRDQRLPLCADKVAVKDMVAATLGSDWVTPTLWHGEHPPAAAPWPRPFVIKARHGCNQMLVVREGDDWAVARRRAARWTRRAYGVWLDEWLYRHIPRGLLVEPFVGGGDALPIDWKFYVFGGRVEFVQVHLDRGGRHRWIVLDRAWRRVSAPTTDADPRPPASLARMIEAAEMLARPFSFVRVDLYDVGGQPRFGELTFYPGSGLDPFDPPSLNGRMGAHWLAAEQAVFATA